MAKREKTHGHGNSVVIEGTEAEEGIEAINSDGKTK